MFDKFLSASHDLVLILLEFLQKAQPDDLTQCDALPFFKGSRFQVLLTKHLNSTCTFPFQNLSSHYFWALGYSIMHGHVRNI